MAAAAATGGAAADAIAWAKVAVETLGFNEVRQERHKDHLPPTAAIAAATAATATTTARSTMPDRRGRIYWGEKESRSAALLFPPAGADVISVVIGGVSVFLLGSSVMRMRRPPRNGPSLQSLLLSRAYSSAAVAAAVSAAVTAAVSAAAAAAAAIVSVAAAASLSVSLGFPRFVLWDHQPQRCYCSICCCYLFYWLHVFFWCLFCLLAVSIVCSEASSGWEKGQSLVIPSCLFSRDARVPFFLLTNPRHLLL